MASSNPKRIELSLTQKTELIVRVKSNALSDEDRDLIAGLICPEQCGGILWNVQPGNIIKITG